MIHFFPTLNSYDNSLTTTSTYDIFIPSFVGQSSQFYEVSSFKNGVFNEMHLENIIFPFKEWSKFDRVTSGDHIRSGTKIFRVDLNYIEAVAAATVSQGASASIEVVGYTASALINKNIYGPGIADETYVVGTSSETSIIISRATYNQIPSGTTLSFSDRNTAQIISQNTSPTQSGTTGGITYTLFQDLVRPDFKTINTTRPTIFWSESDPANLKTYLRKRNFDQTVFKASFNNDGTPLDKFPPGLEAGSFESVLTSIELLKSSVEGGINNFNTVARFDAQQFKVTRFFYDYLIEPGMLYRYKLQGVRSDGSRGQSTPILDQINIIPDFTGSFIYGKNNIQINFIYNGTIESFVEIKRDVLLETIGGKYPFIIRNSSVGYKQFSFSAFITQVSDPTRALGGFTYSELLSRKKVKDNFIDERYEDYLRTGAQFFSQAEQSAFGSINRVTPPLDFTNIDRTNNFIVEKEFRKKLMDWLYDGEPKVFKSDTEGLFLVKLTDISFTPILETGRVIYSFSCTANEIGPIDIESLTKFGIIKEIYRDEDLSVISDIENFVIPWKSEILLPSNQYFVFEGRFYKSISAGKTDILPPTGTDESIIYGDEERLKFIFIGYSIPGRF